MKIRISESLPFLLLLTSTALILVQITLPIIKGKFGMDADVQNNWFNNALFTVDDNDDWNYRNGFSRCRSYFLEICCIGQYNAGGRYYLFG